MKTLNKALNIEGQEFVLIEDVTPEGRKFYGTIAHEDLDAQGQLKRALTGLDMWASFESQEDAIHSRTVAIKIERFRTEHPDFKPEELMEYVMSL